MSRRIIVAVLLIAGLSVLVAAGAAGEGISKRSTYAPKDCAKPKVRPSRMVLACGDFGLFVEAKHYHHWGGRKARGHGVLHANECTPSASCGPRDFTRYRVRFKLHEVRHKRCGGQTVPLFTKINLRFHKRKPSYARRIRESRLFCNP